MSYSTQLDAERDGMSLAWWAQRQRDVPALRLGDRQLSYAQLNERVNRCARLLRSLGVKVGDGVAVLAPNGFEFAEVYLAARRIGSRVTPINWHLFPDEVAYIVDDCRATVFIVDPDIATESISVGPDVRVLRLGKEYEDALEGQPGHDIDDPQLGNIMLYTSGTTGRPKGVFTRREVPPSPRGLEAAGYHTGDVHLVTGPLYHSAPLAFSLRIPLLCGATVSMMPRFDAIDFLATVELERVTHTHLVPTMMHRLVRLDDAVRAARDVSTMRWIIHGAAPCPPDVKRSMIEWFGPVVTEYYGSTEGLVSLCTSRGWVERPGTVGRPAAGSVKIGDAEGDPLPSNASGTVWIRRAEEPFSYFGDSTKTADSHRGDWFTVGDVGHLDDDGYLFLTDRSANLIVTGGVNVYPAEIDAVLLAHPFVADAVTIGVPDAEWGEQIVAVVERRPGSDGGFDEAHLLSHCREFLPAFKCPKRVEFIDHLPRRDNGKVHRDEVRTWFRVRVDGRVIRP